jgi:NAD(P)-dependent dehydrogenase (short-subunit alcohol dehydrogenase family)
MQAAMASSISKQSVLITGCSKNGIGDALAQRFLSRGFLVFATARNVAKIQHLKDQGCEIMALDVTDEKSVLEAVEHVSEKAGGKLHYLINNAGMSKPPRFLPHFIASPTVYSVALNKVFMLKLPQHTELRSWTRT